MQILIFLCFPIPMLEKKIKKRKCWKKIIKSFQNYVSTFRKTEYKKQKTDFEKFKLDWWIQVWKDFSSKNFDFCSCGILTKKKIYSRHCVSAVKAVSHTASHDEPSGHSLVLTSFAKATNCVYFVKHAGKVDVVDDEVVKAAQSVVCPET